MDRRQPYTVKVQVQWRNAGQCSWDDHPTEMSVASRKVTEIIAADGTSILIHTSEPMYWAPPQPEHEEE